MSLDKKIKPLEYPPLTDTKKLMDFILGHGDYIPIKYLLNHISDKEFVPDFLMCMDCGQGRILPSEKDEHDKECPKGEMNGGKSKSHN